MRIFCILYGILYSILAFSHDAELLNKAFTHHLYAGPLVGYGSTTWNGLVPSTKNQNLALSISTPILVKEGGGVWGFFAGYEFSPYFALEGSYTRYPKASIFFDEESLFAFENDGRLDLRTDTETGSVMAKVMLFIPRTTVRAYSSVGVAQVHRWDDINENNRIAPTFGIGLNYNFAEHLMAELGANYTAGYGESELNPAKDYEPFLFSVFFKLAYRV